MGGGVDFGVEQVGEELRVAGLVALGVLESGRETLSDRVQPEVGEVLAELLVGGVGHQQASASAA